jgi:hypothetical protein
MDKSNKSFLDCFLSLSTRARPVVRHASSAGAQRAKLLALQVDGLERVEGMHWVASCESHCKNNDGTKVRVKSPDEYVI